MTELQEYIKSYFGIENQHLELIAEMFQPSVLAKDEYYVKSDQYCNKLSFIKSGNLRIFDFTDTKEVTQWIASKGEFVTDLSSMIFDTKCKNNIQALEDCSLYTINKENYQKIGNLIPKWDKLEKLFIAKCFITLENRVYTFLSMTAEERYLQFFSYKPELFNQVPLQYLASLLGMTPETFSRIRKKLSS